MPRVAIAAVLALALPACSSGGGETGSADTSATSVVASSTSVETTTTTEAVSDGDQQWALGNIRQAILDDGRLFGLADDGSYRGQIVSIDLRKGGDTVDGPVMTEFAPTLASGETAAVEVGSSGAWSDAQPSGGAPGSTEFRVWHDSDGSAVVVGVYEIQSTGDGINAGRNERNIVAFDAETGEQLWTVGPLADQPSSDPGALFPGVDGVGVAAVCTPTTVGQLPCGLAGIDPSTGDALWAQPADDYTYYHYLGESGRFLSADSDAEVLSVVNPTTGEATPLPIGTDIPTLPAGTACTADRLALVPGFSNLRDARQSDDVDVVDALTALNDRGAIQWSFEASSSAEVLCSAESSVAVVAQSEAPELSVLDAGSGEVRWQLSSDQADRFTLYSLWPDGVAGTTPTGPVLLSLDDGTQSTLAEDDWRLIAGPWTGVFDDDLGLALAVTSQGLVAWAAHREPIGLIDDEDSDEGGLPIPVFES